MGTQGVITTPCVFYSGGSTMKLFSLSIFRIYGYLRYHRLTFILFFVGITLASFVFTYFYSNTKQVEIATAESRVEYRSYMLLLSENTPITEAKVHLLDSYGIKDVQIGCSVILNPDTLATQPDGAEDFI